jgi:hypothetical protein
MHNCAKNVYLRTCDKKNNFNNADIITELETVVGKNSVLSSSQKTEPDSVEKNI